jgi:hypothetical protein
MFLASSHRGIMRQVFFMFLASSHRGNAPCVLAAIEAF